MGKIEPEEFGQISLVARADRSPPRTVHLALLYRPKQWMGWRHWEHIFEGPKSAAEVRTPDERGVDLQPFRAL